MKPWTCTAKVSLSLDFPLIFLDPALGFFVELPEMHPLVTVLVARLVDMWQCRILAVAEVVQEASTTAMAVTGV